MSRRPAHATERITAALCAIAAGTSLCAAACGGTTPVQTTPVDADTAGSCFETPPAGRYDLECYVLSEEDQNTWVVLFIDDDSDGVYRPYCVRLIKLRREPRSVTTAPSVTVGDDGLTTLVFEAGLDPVCPG